MRHDRPTSFSLAIRARERAPSDTRPRSARGVAVAVDEFVETPSSAHPRNSSRGKTRAAKILVGTGGTTDSRRRHQARKRIEALVGARCISSSSFAWTPRWRDAPRMLAELGTSRAPNRPREGRARERQADAMIPIVAVVGRPTSARARSSPHGRRKVAIATTCRESRASAEALAHFHGRTALLVDNGASIPRATIDATGIIVR